MAGAVIDASVVVKWFLEEDRTREARAILSSDEPFFAPSAVLFEVMHAVWTAARNGRTSYDSVRRTERQLLMLFPEAAPDGSLFADAVRLMREHQHPIYDLLYLALASDIGATLVTADERQFAVARKARIPARLL